MPVIAELGTFGETRTCGGCEHYRHAQPAGCGVLLPMWLHWTSGDRLTSPSRDATECEAFAPREAKP